MKNNIWFHADDFGVTSEQSARILECHRNGVLNSVSILPNTKELRESKALLDSADPDGCAIRRVLHINLVEGMPLSGEGSVPLLTDRGGYFDKSFVQYLKWNYLKTGAARSRLKDQLKSEIAAQLRAVTVENDCGITAVDSHQHYHMIPIIFDSLMEVLADGEFESLDIRQIRIPVDPASPILCNRKMRRGVPAINWAKWCILRLYADRNRKLLQKRGINAPVFFGIFYTCEMTKEVVESLLPAYEDYADRKDCDLELMFHPGNLMAAYELLDARRKELEEFYMSDNRYYEAECLKTIKHLGSVHDAV